MTTASAGELEPIRRRPKARRPTSAAHRQIMWLLVRSGPTGSSVAPDPESAPDPVVPNRSLQGGGDSESGRDGKDDAVADGRRAQPGSHGEDPATTADNPTLR